MKKKRRQFGSYVLFISALAALALVLLIRPPSWWAPPPIDDRAAIAMGENFENACITEMHRAREPSKPWAVRVHDDEVNAWLATRLPKWLEHAGMSKIALAQVRFEEGSIVLASDVSDVPTVAVIEVTPVMTKDGLAVERTNVAVGRLPLPFAQGVVLGPLLGALNDADAPPEVRVAAALLRGESLKPEFKLADGRIVRLRDLELHDGELTLEFETLLRKP